MHLMRLFFDWLKLPAAISAELSAAFHSAAGKVSGQCPRNKRGFCRLGPLGVGVDQPAAQLRRSGVGVDQAETHAHGGGGADIRAADG
jgi:hypothetical protein